MNNILVRVIDIHASCDAPEVAYIDSECVCLVSLNAVKSAAVTSAQSLLRPSLQAEGQLPLLLHLLAL